MPCSRRVRRAGRAPSRARPSRSMRGSTIWSAPTRSACPESATVSTHVNIAAPGNAQSGVRRPGARRCRAHARRRGAVRDGRAAGIRLAHAAAGGDRGRPIPISSRARSTRSPMRRRRASRAAATLVIVETAAGRRAGTPAIEGVLADRPTAPGLAFTARRGAVPAAGTPVGTGGDRGGGAAILLGACSAPARRAAPQRHALRLPDPQPEGAEPRPRRRDERRRAARGAGLCGGRGRDLPRARRRCCWRCGRAARRSAGRSSSRTRA